MKLDIQRVLVASTGHLTHADFEIMQAWEEGNLTQVTTEASPLVASYPYGWLLWVEHPDEEYEALSVSARQLVTLAREHQCQWLRLDSDGDEVDGVPTHGHTR